VTQFIEGLRERLEQVGAALKSRQVTALAYAADDAIMRLVWRCAGIEYRLAELESRVRDLENGLISSMTVKSYHERRDS